MTVRFEHSLKSSNDQWPPIFEHLDSDVSKKEVIGKLFLSLHYLTPRTTYAYHLRNEKMDHLVQSMEFKIDFTYNKLLAGLKMFQPRGQTYWEDDSVDVSLTRIFELITRIELSNIGGRKLDSELIMGLHSENNFSIVRVQITINVWRPIVSTLEKDKISYRHTRFWCNGSSHLRYPWMETTFSVYWRTHWMATFYQFLSTLGKFKSF